MTRLVVAEVSSQLVAEDPELQVGDRLCWRVPVALTSPARGVVGRVGAIAVDATTGEVRADEGAWRRMSEDARRLAERSPP